jgi:hypothetical protein
MLLDVARTCGGPRVVGEGRNICGMVSNAEGADPIKEREHRV